jgi:hypothetical protein
MDNFTFSKRKFNALFTRGKYEGRSTNACKPLIAQSKFTNLKGGWTSAKFVACSPRSICSFENGGRGGTPIKESSIKLDNESREHSSPSVP